MGAFRFYVQSGGLAVADDMQWCVAAFNGAVRDGVGFAVEFGGFGLVFQLIAEQTQQRYDQRLRVSVVAGLSAFRVSSLR